MKGLQKLQVNKAKCSQTWDLSILETYLGTSGMDSNLSCPDLAAKMAVLLLMYHFVRFTEMVSISIGSIRYRGERGNTELSFVSKTNQTRLTRVQILPNVKGHKTTACIKEYVRRLNAAHPDVNHASQLFTDIASGLPYSVETVRELARSLMAKAGINTSRFTAYSLKAAGVSKLIKDGYSLREVEDRARLSHKSKTLTKYYVKPIVESQTGEGNSGERLPKISSCFLPRPPPECWERL
jgi:site-specific recombinase XerD